MAVVLGGCAEWDSFFNPSVLGRWEQTPTVVPVLERIAAIESDDGEFVDYTEVSSDDLVPQVDEYEIGAADSLQLTIWDLEIPGQPSVLPRLVDPNGYIEVPQIGRVFIAGLTEAEANARISQALSPILQNPLVSVLITGRRQQTYHLQGNVRAPGAYPIPTSDFKLLEALIVAGGVNETSSDFIYVIRQVTLDERLDGDQGETSAPVVVPGSAPPTVIDRQPQGAPAPDGDELIDLIDSLIDEGDADGEPGVMASTSSGYGAGAGGVGSIASVQPADREAAPPVELVDDLSPATGGVTGVVPRASAGVGRWVFINGQWTQATAASGSGVAEDGQSDDGEPVVTQRVVRVPVKPLLAGDARYNIVVRAGDVIRVPPPEVGNVYLSGQVTRPGVYQLPVVGRGLTLTRLIAAGGGLAPIAIPERVDLTRMVGPNRQATIMLNLRAITEGTQPDVFLKPDDVVNVGTNFWALPLAVIRGGFRMSYGFGFLLDRNFGNDVFGPPPLAQPGVN